MIGILVVLILPMPRLLLDLLLALSIAFSVLVLLTSLFIVRRLEFSGFRTVLMLREHAEMEQRSQAARLRPPEPKAAVLPACSAWFS